jgi:adenylate cyclase, class 2
LNLMHINYEFKAQVNNSSQLEAALSGLSPLFAGEDHQVDTYFNVPNGRLKLREGNIENALIHYERTNTAGAKQSNVLLYQHQPDSNLKKLLVTALGVKAVVDKKRKIYFIENVKFHFDNVKDLGTFVEVEAIDKDGTIGLDKLKQQCAEYISLFGLQPSQFMAESYSDMVLAKKSSTA